jgi:hypothetical protein
VQRHIDEARATSAVQNIWRLSCNGSKAPLVMPLNYTQEANLSNLPPKATVSVSTPCITQTHPTRCDSHPVSVWHISASCKKARGTASTHKRNLSSCQQLSSQSATLPDSTEDSAAGHSTYEPPTLKATIMCWRKHAYIQVLEHVQPSRLMPRMQHSTLSNRHS